MWLSSWLPRSRRRAEPPQGKSADPRRDGRWRDGSPTAVTGCDGKVHPGVIVDVSASGLRLCTRAPLRLGQRVSCRVEFSDHAELLAMRVLWLDASRPGEEAQVGLRHEPLLPGTHHLLGNYMLKVLQRAA